MTEEQHAITTRYFSGLNSATKTATDGRYATFKQLYDALTPDAKQIVARAIANSGFDECARQGNPVPAEVRAEYWRQWNLYEAQQEAEQNYRRYEQQRINRETLQPPEIRQDQAAPDK